MSFYKRLKAFLFRRQRNDDLENEIAAHVSMDVQERMDAGESPLEARRGARRDLGSPLRVEEDTRAAWGWRWSEELGQDLAYGVRVLRRAPAFTLGAVAVLGLGVGVNLAEFQIFDAMVFHRLTIRDADSFLQFSHISKQGARPGFPSAATEFYRAKSAAFAWLVSEDTTFDVVVESDTGLHSNLVSANYFSSLGIVPERGRLLDERDGQPDATAVAVLGFQYWQTRWAGNPEVVGTVIHVNNKPVQIVGVLPSTFEGLTPRQTHVWLPLDLRPRSMAGSLPVQEDFSRTTGMLYGKLKAGVSQVAGEAELDSLTRELIQREPRYSPDDIRGQLVQQSMIRRVSLSAPFAVFVVMVLLVLLSACANLGNMLLAQGLARQHEIGIRNAIGASRNRIVRQLMTENFLMAVLGSAAGLVFGNVAARLLLDALGTGQTIHLSMRWPIFVIGILLTFASTAAFGLPAALQTVRPNERKIRLRQSLVGIQVTVSCLLLIASGILAHNGILSASLDLAFDYKNMIAISPQFYGRDLPNSAARQKLDALSNRLRELPGVDSVTTVVVPPLGNRFMIDSIPGLPRVYRNAVLPSYFSLMNLPFLRGRPFLGGEQNAVIVSESAAHAIWPNQDALGKTWNLGGADRTVVGITKDSGANLFAAADSIEAYVPIQDVDVQRSSLIVHTRGNTASVAGMVPSAAAALDETVSVSLMQVSRDRFFDAQQRMVILIGSIGAVATALAAAGMFALVTFTVAQRRREIGIRMAIGATSRHILGVLLTENVKPAAIGVVAGTVLAIILGRLVRSLIVLQNHDAVDLGGFALGLACFVFVAVVSTLSPAWLALRIDPSTTLRER